MYYLYFVYTAFAASLMFYECYRKNHPKWWALMVLAAPVTAPYFIIKTKKDSGLLVFGFIATFLLVCSVELYLYSSYMEKNKYSHLPIVTRQMIGFAQDLKTSTLKLDHALVKLENLSKVESRIHEIKKTIEFIDSLRITMNENQKAIQQLVKHALVYKQFFTKKDLSWVFHIQQFYQNRNVTQHYKSLQKYLDDFEGLLKYTYVNFYNITEHKSEEHFKNYDEYYLKYRRSVDAHNRFNVKRLDYQNSFLKKYPDARPYLPGERQTETFKLWE